MLKKAVVKKQLVLSAQTVRVLTAYDLGRVNGGQVQAEVASTQSATIEVCSSTSR